MYEINETHDPSLMSWVESANLPNTDFPIQNLPFCIFGSDAVDDEIHIGVRIGNEVLNLDACADAGLLGEIEDDESIGGERLWGLLDGIMAFSGEGRRALRSRISELLREGSVEQTSLESHLVPAADCLFEDMPAVIGDYTDFYCSIYHATNVGSMFRPDNPLLPNYKYVPIGYHGRASSIVISGTDIKRPKGQNRSEQEAPPVFIPSKSLDYEMELGFFVGRGNELGTSIPISDAEQHIFGVCLVNDWSARDIQAWEYQPLGPFLAKNFATTISPYVVTMDALAPFRTSAFERDPDDPQPLGYLNGEQNQKLGGLDINLEVYIQTEKMRDEKIEPHLLSRSNTKDLYWTIGQMLTHHASNGCNLQTGDLMATGTVSGKEKSERGCLLELTWRGTEPIDLPSGEQRRFLEDGDEIIMKGYCEREGFRRIGLGECRGRILPAD
ncbi:MAG: fumarylacetoacetase [Acidobacteria bacterium]|nr:fumarylacetoacetase [Acidobacteriota bacterium]MCW5948624.1 fumarylacetoacetase [Pyrinomonadaceae bacterium]